MPRPRQRTPELRERIVAAAHDLLEAQGPSGVTTRAVAAAAGTSAPAIYELLGDKTGLIRALFFDGFGRLVDAYAATPVTDDPLADLHARAATFRRFALDHPQLFDVMYGSAFEAFSPGPDEWAIGAAARDGLVAVVTRAVGVGALDGDPVDIAHALLAVSLGLARQEIGGWLGASAADRDRRWTVSVSAVLGGFATS